VDFVGIETGMVSRSRFERSIDLPCRSKIISRVLSDDAEIGVWEFAMDAAIAAAGGGIDVDEVAGVGGIAGVAGSIKGFGATGSLTGLGAACVSIGSVG
jgi:hypothetical protein